MSSRGLELLLRVITRELGTEQCERCGNPLADSRIALRESKPDHVIVEVLCSSCDRTLLLQVKPEADGFARVT